MENRYLVMISGIALFYLQGCSCKDADDAKPNVLFICVDDLRRDLGCYDTEVKTPNIDRLASEGVLFCNQYVSAPTSGASRYGMLTGRYPVSGTDLFNDASAIQLSGQPEGESPETMFHHLRRNGYYTVGIGKISHSADGYVYPYEGDRSDKLELPYSWDEMLFDPGRWKILQAWRKIRLTGFLWIVLPARLPDLTTFIHNCGQPPIIKFKQLSGFLPGVKYRTVFFA